jgi:hypothetical protein
MDRMAKCLKARESKWPKVLVVCTLVPLGLLALLVAVGLVIMIIPLPRNTTVPPPHLEAVDIVPKVDWPYGDKRLLAEISCARSDDIEMFLAEQGEELYVMTGSRSDFATLWRISSTGPEKLREFRGKVFAYECPGGGLMIIEPAWLQLDSTPATETIRIISVVDGVVQERIRKLGNGLSTIRIKEEIERLRMVGPLDNEASELFFVSVRRKGGFFNTVKQMDECELLCCTGKDGDLGEPQSIRSDGMGGIDSAPVLLMSGKPYRLGLLWEDWRFAGSGCGLLVYYSQYAGGKWTNEVALTPPAYCLWASPYFASSSGSDVLFVWSPGPDFATQKGVFARRLHAETWGPIERISGNGNVCASDSSIDGTAVVAVAFPKNYLRLRCLLGDSWTREYDVADLPQGDNYAIRVRADGSFILAVGTKSKVVIYDFGKLQ